MRHFQVCARFVRFRNVFVEFGTWQENRVPGVTIVATKYAIGLTAGNRFVGLTW